MRRTKRIRGTCIAVAVAVVAMGPAATSPSSAETQHGIASSAGTHTFAGHHVNGDPPCEQTYQLDFQATYPNNAGQGIEVMGREFNGAFESKVTSRPRTRPWYENPDGNYEWYVPFVEGVPCTRLGPGNPLSGFSLTVTGVDADGDTLTCVDTPDNPAVAADPNQPESALGGTTYKRNGPEVEFHAITAQCTLVDAQDPLDSRSATKSILIHEEYLPVGPPTLAPVSQQFTEVTAELEQLETSGWWCGRGPHRVGLGGHRRR